MSPRRTVPVAETARLKAAVVRAPRRIRSIRDVALTFLGIPLVFVASAGFMWSRPLDTASVEASHAPRPVQARFTRIGEEMTSRSSLLVQGAVTTSRAVTKTKLRSAPQALISATTALEQSSPSKAPSPAISTSRVQTLEKQVYRILKKHGKPVQNGKELAAAIVREALAQDYDAVFVAAVIKSESAFNSLARSNKGAQGLMQIMPRTGAWLADQQAIPRRKLTDPGHNLKLGISYLKQLEHEYGGNRMLTLMAYNWGPGHVASASKGARRVPGEVMQYAVKILNDYRRWSSELGTSVG